MRTIIYLRILSGTHKVSKFSVELSFQLVNFWDVLDKNILKDEVNFIFEW